MAGTWLSDEDFKKGLSSFVMPTSDLIIERGKEVLILYRTIEPYKNVWALPGLRLRKGETTQQLLERTVKDEVGLSMEIDPEKLLIVGQYDGVFTKEKDGVDRQDLSTCRILSIPEGTIIKPNPEHFSKTRFITAKNQIPEKGEIGEMYRYFLNKYFDSRQ